MNTVNRISATEILKFYVKLCTGDASPEHLIGSNAVIQSKGIEKGWFNPDFKEKIISTFTRQVKNLSCPLRLEDKIICELYADELFCKEIERRTSLNLYKVSFAARRVLEKDLDVSKKETGSKTDL